MVDGDCRQFCLAPRVTGAAIQAGAEDCPAGLMPAGDFLRLRRGRDDTDFDADKSEIKLKVRPDPVLICLKASHICGLDLLIDSMGLLTDGLKLAQFSQAIDARRCPLWAQSCATLALPGSTFRLPKWVRLRLRTQLFAHIDVWGRFFLS